MNFIKQLLPNLKKVVTPIGLLYLSLFIISSLINTLFVDFFIAHSDFRFPVEFIDFFERHFYIWSTNSGAINLDGTVRIIGRLPVILSFLISQNQIIASYFFIIYSLAFGIISFYLFSYRVLEIKDKSLNLLLSLIFVFNPIFLGNFSKLGLVFSAYLIPLLIVCANEIFVKRKIFPYAIFILLLLNLSFVHPFNLFVNIIITGTFILSKMTVKDYRDFIFGNISKLIIVAFVGLLMNIYVLVPLLSIGTVDKQILSNSIGEGADTLNLIDISRNTGIVESLTLTKSIFVEYSFYDENYRIWYEVAIFLLYLFILVLIFIKFKSFSREDKSWLLFQSLTFAFLILLATGTAYPFIGNVLKFVTETPFGWFFRSPLKWQLYIPFSLVILIAIVLKRISNYNFLSISKMIVGTLSIISSLFILVQVYTQLIKPKKIKYFPETAKINYNNKKVLLSNDIKCRELFQDYGLRNELNIIFSSEKTTFKILNDSLLYNNYSVYSLFDYVVTCNSNLEFPNTFSEVASDSNFGVYVHRNNNKIDNVISPQQLVNISKPNLANEEFEFFYNYTQGIPLSTAKNDLLDSRYLTKVFSPFETSNINEPFSEYDFNFNFQTKNKTKLISDNSIQSILYTYFENAEDKTLKVFSNQTPAIEKDGRKVFEAFGNVEIFSKTVSKDNDLFIGINEKVYDLKTGDNFLTYISTSDTVDLLVVDNLNNELSESNSGLNKGLKCVSDGKDYFLKISFVVDSFTENNNCPNYLINNPDDNYLLNVEYDKPDNLRRPDYFISIDTDLDKLDILTDEQYLQVINPSILDNITIYGNKESEKDINLRSLKLNKISEKVSFSIIEPKLKFDEKYIDISDDNLRLKISSQEKIQNLVANGSFENGLWQNVVDDCYNYDKNPQISMETVDENDNKKLQLSATRHIACTSTDINLTGVDQVLLSLDYDIISGNRGGYAIRFNDKDKSEFREVFRDEVNGKSGTIKQTIDIPSGATSGRLTLFAFQSDEINENTVVYDNINAYPVTILKDKYFVLEDATVITEEKPDSSYSQISPSKREVKLSGLNSSGKDQIIFFNEIFSDKWDLIGENGNSNQKRIKINNLVTAFKIDKDQNCDGDNCKLNFIFREQRIFLTSLIISGIVWIVVLAYTINQIPASFSIFKINRKKDT